MSWKQAVIEARSLFARQIAQARSDVQAEHEAVGQRHETELVEAHVHLLESISAAFRRAAPGKTTDGGVVADRAMAAWDEDAWRDLSLSTSAERAGHLVRIGTFELADLPSRPTKVLRGPALIPLVGQNNLLLEATGENLDRANEVLQAIAFRMLATVSPGRVHVLGIDSVGLGNNLTCLSGLADTLKGPKFLHNEREIGAALEGLISRMATIVQKYLGNKYSSIDEYNADAGQVAEPYRLVLVNNFPAGFKPDSAKNLLAVAKNGPQVGVHVLLSRDTQFDVPHGFSLQDLERTSTVLRSHGNQFDWRLDDSITLHVELDPNPPSSTVNAFTKKLNDHADTADDVKVPFADFSPDPAEYWKVESTRNITTPIGRLGARDELLLRLGERTQHHVLVGGRTGSGKTVLLHAAILGLAQRYSPDELEFYLIDFKEGVEFSVYRDLPHARVVAIEAEREFGLSVLEGLHKELNRRGELGRASRTESLTAYREKTHRTLSRILLVADEFQVFFEQNDRLSSRARWLLDDLVSRGRSFGIHCSLSSQTLRSMDLEPSTLSQLGVRIALQMSESDSHKVLGKDNDEAKLLDRPGAAIYNPAGGQPEHNTKFQVAFLGQRTVQHLVAELADLAASRGFTNKPVVFEGNRPASLGRNDVVRQGLDDPASTIPRFYDLYLGEPTTLQEGHACWRMRRQSRGNLLMLGNRPPDAFHILSGILASLTSQLPHGSGVLRILNLLNVDDPLFDRLDLYRNLPLRTEIVHRTDLARLVDETHSELVDRHTINESTPVQNRPMAAPHFLVLFGLQGSRGLKKDGYQPSETGGRLLELVREGPDLGIHVIVWADTMSNLLGVFKNTDLSEFGGKLVLTGGDATRALGAHHQPAPKLTAGYSFLLDEEDNEHLHKVHNYGEQATMWFSTWLSEQPNTKI